MPRSGISKARIGITIGKGKSRHPSQFDKAKFSISSSGNCYRPDEFYCIQRSSSLITVNEVWLLNGDVGSNEVPVWRL
jgi:hypothetical protein